MIHIIERRHEHSLEELEALAASRGGRVIAADFYVNGAETWEPVLGGLEHQDGRVVNVDHHAPLSSMQRHVTSTMLAIERVRAGLGPDPAKDLVVINHMDCDSVLSSGILSRRLDPEDELAEASVAADHTGKEHPVADLLQGMDAHWSRTKRPTPGPEGLEQFLENLRRLTSGKPLDDFAVEAVDRRRQARKRAAELMADDRFDREAGVHFWQLDEPIEGELILPLVPEAVVVATANPHPKHPERWQMKVRLGLGAPAGLSLQKLGISTFDERYGGRWNAGSNNRGGGTSLEPEAYRRRLVQAMREHEVFS